MPRSLVKVSRTACLSLTSRTTRAPRMGAAWASTTNPRRAPRDCAGAETQRETLRTRRADDLNIDFIFILRTLSLSGECHFQSDSVAIIGEANLPRLGPPSRLI